MMKLLFCIGTRPEAIKLAPLIQCAQRQGIEVRVATTGQHVELLSPFIGLFQIPVHHSLSALKANQSLAELTAAVLIQIRPILQAEKPDHVVVQGDTTTALACAMAAFYEKINVVHVEAGLRTHQHYSPFPEEMNRRLIGGIANFHFAPTELAKANLGHEGIHEHVYVTGNTGVDALRITLEQMKPAITTSQEKTILVTCHRRENHGGPLAEICDSILDIVNTHLDTKVIFPVHLNPNVKQVVQDKLGSHPRIELVEPLGYQEFAAAMRDCTLLLTDSGGIQEEAPYLKKPIFVLRESTERPEGVAAGVSMLVGSNRKNITETVGRALTDPTFYQQFQKSVNPYGDGFASEKILGILSSSHEKNNHFTHS